MDELFTFARDAPGTWVHLSMGQQLRALRKHHGLSQKDVAARSGLAQSIISRAESGSDARWSTLERLFSLYGCRPLVVPYRGYPVLSERRAHALAVVEDLKRTWDAKLKAKTRV